MKCTWKTAKVLKNKLTKITHASRDGFLPKKDNIEISLNNLCPCWVPTDPKDIRPSLATNDDFFDTHFTYAELDTSLNSREDKSAPDTDGVNYEVLHNNPVKYQFTSITCNE